MRPIASALAAHLATGATTLATCWILRRSDGVVMGFTDHDRDLVLDGVTCRAATGFEASDVTSELGFAISGGDVSGALRDDGITDADIEAGRYDGASLETVLVNWADVAQRLRVSRATIGEIRRADGAFTVELRSPVQALNQTMGRLYQRTCDADLGDARCGIDLSGPDRRAAGTVARAAGRLAVETASLGAYASGWFTGGRLVWTAGANAGEATQVKTHRGTASTALLELWRPPARAIAAGDAFTVTAGCDKRFETCRDKFGNSLNFRGFPHIPGNDRVLSGARAGDRNDGSSLGL